MAPASDSLIESNVKTLGQSVGWLGGGAADAAPLFVHILPVALGYRTNTAALGWKWSRGPSVVMDSLTAAASPDTNDAIAAPWKTAAGHQGIEAEAIA